jgi:DNA helicase HerA-like ATPase
MPVVDIVPLPNFLRDDILRAGGIIVGSRGTGKSNLAKIIASQLINTPDIQIKISDPTQNWVHKFAPILYQTINEETLLPNEIYFGEEHILYDIELVDVNEIQEAIGLMAFTDYDLQRAFKKEDLMNSWILWVIEEAQNILGSYALNGTTGKGWLKIISECRNFNINFLFVAQRLSDVSTKAVERCDSYFFGRSIGDNDRKKIERICGKSSGVSEIVPRLQIGEFIYWNGTQAYKLRNVPKYDAITKPILWHG